MSNGSKKITYIDCLTEENGTRYFMPSDYHCLIKEDLNNKKMEIVTYFKNMPYKQKNIYIKIFKWKEKIICLPWHVTSIAVVNEKSREVKYIKIPKIEKSKIQNSFFKEGMQIGKNIYAVGYSYFGILKIDCETLEVEVIDDWLQYYKKNSVCEKNSCFSMSSFRIENKIYLICSEFPSVFMYDFKNEVYEFINMKKWTKELVALSGDEKFLWVITKEGKILLYNSETKTVEDVKKICEISEKEVCNIYKYGNNLHILLLEKKAIICLNEIMQKVDVIEMPLEIQNITDEIPYNVQIDKETILLCYCQSKKMWKYNLRDKRFYDYELPIKKGVFDLRSFIKDNSSLIINEDYNVDFTLETFLNVIKKDC